MDGSVTESCDLDKREARLFVSCAICTEEKDKPWEDRKEWASRHLCIVLSVLSGSIIKPILSQKGVTGLSLFWDMKAKELWLRADEWITTVIKTLGEEKWKTVWTGKKTPETSMSSGSETCTSLFKKTRKRKEECSLSFLIFSMESTTSSKSCPLFLCPCFPCYTKKKNHFCISSKWHPRWGYWPTGYRNSTYIG